MHTEAVIKGGIELLKDIFSMKETEKFSLVGGTNLALRFGHRISEDLDLFSVEKFNEKELEIAIKEKFSDVKTMEGEEQRMLYYINGIKTEFIRFKYPLMNKIEKWEGIKMDSLKDTIAGKLLAIVNRSTKKDYYDIHEFLKSKSMEELLGCYQKRYQQENTVPLVKALTYFWNAERQDNPISLNNTTWENVKSNLRQSVNNYVRAIEIKHQEKGMNSKF